MDGGWLKGVKHNVIYRWRITELYTWNLYNFINQVTPIKALKRAKKESVCLNLPVLKKTKNFVIVYIGIFQAYSLIRECEDVQRSAA